MKRSSGELPSLPIREKYLKTSCESYNLATVMKATCGRNVADDDELVSLIDEVAGLVTAEDAPGSAVIDLLPACEWPLRSSYVNDEMDPI